MKKAVLVILFHFSLPMLFAQHLVLYGITGGGGKYNEGVIYRYDPQNGQYDTVHSLNYNNDGRSTWAGLTLATNGLLYGMTEDGGSHGYGVMFSFNSFTNKDSVIINFDSSHNGAYEADGNSLMQASNGLLYGTREVGGSHDSGVLFSYNTLTGKDTILINFDLQLGAFPNRTVVEDTSTGFLYGTTYHGGAKDFGVIYRYDPKTNKDTVVFNFDSTGENGVLPSGTLFMASNGMFYGMTTYGGSPLFNGTLYRFNPKTFHDTTLIRFTGPNGAVPGYSNLIRANDGLLYGKADGGSNNDGVLFSFDISTNQEKVLVNFNGANGWNQSGDLIQDLDNGLLYGIAEQGGSNNMGVIFCYNLITGKDSVVVNFDGTNGAYPVREPTLVRDTPTAVNELKIKNYELKIYPNPNNGVFTISAPSLPPPVEGGVPRVDIYNILGEKIYSSNITATTTELNLSKEAKGLYLYRVISESGELISQGKFIIQ